MWIKVEDTVHFGFRAAVVSISRCDFVNYTGKHAKEFFELLKEGLNPALVEDQIREILLKMFPQSAEWSLLQCGFNMSWQTIDVIVQHPSFGMTHPSCELPRLSKTFADPCEE
jgi:hypothetical protein